MQNEQNPKRVLLTGASGFVGAHTLIHFLHNTDWHIVCPVSFRHEGKSDRIEEMIHRSHPEYLDRVTIITHDLTAPFSKQTIERIGRIDYVVNMASLSNVDDSIKHPREFFLNNVNLMYTMVEFVNDRKKHAEHCSDCFNKFGVVEKFLQISTDEVYGPAPPDYDHKEGEPHRPSNTYSASKAAQEDIGHSEWRQNDLPYIQTNTMNIIGEMQDIGKLMPRAVAYAVKGKTMPIFADKDGSTPGTRKYLHARNQADALLFILRNVPVKRYLDGHTEPEIINVVGEKELSNLEMAKLAASFTGHDLKYELVDFHSARPGHDLRYSLDGSKLAKLGWKAPMSLEKSIESTVKWTLEHPEWML